MDEGSKIGGKRWLYVKKIELSCKCQYKNVQKVENKNVHFYSIIYTKLQDKYYFVNNYQEKLHRSEFY